MDAFASQMMVMRLSKVNVGCKVGWIVTIMGNFPDECFFRILRVFRPSIPYDPLVKIVHGHIKQHKRQIRKWNQSCQAITHPLQSTNRP